MPNGRCRLHGGLSPSGAASARFKHGRYSRSVPTRLAARYAEAAADPQLIELSEELALVDARIADVLARVDTGEAGATWRALGNAVTAYRKAEARGAGGEGDRAAAFDFIEDLAGGGRGDYAAWDEVHKLIEQRRKLAQAEARRMAALGQMITAERAMTLVGAVVAVVRSHVTDRETLKAISAGVGRLIGGEGTGADA